MHPAKLARISALVLILFLTSLAAFAAPPCGCSFCQRFPEKDCASGGAVMTCAQFLTVALCPAPPAASTEAPSSEAALFAAISGTTQEPTGCLNPTN